MGRKVEIGSEPSEGIEIRREPEKPPPTGQMVPPPPEGPSGSQTSFTPEEGSPYTFGQGAGTTPIGTAGTFTNQLFAFKVWVSIGIGLSLMVIILGSFSPNSLALFFSLLYVILSILVCRGQPQGRRRGIKWFVIYSIFLGPLTIIWSTTLGRALLFVLIFFVIPFSILSVYNFEGFMSIAIQLKNFFQRKEFAEIIRRMTRNRL